MTPAALPSALVAGTSSRSAAALASAAERRYGERPEPPCPAAAMSSQESGGGRRRRSAQGSRTKRGAVSARKSAARARRDGGGTQSILRQLTRIEQDGGDGILVFGQGRTLAVSSLAKVFFPDDGYTKGDVMRYYVRVAPVLLSALEGRPLTLKRYPNGITGPSFFQHDPGENAPDAVRVARVMTDEGLQLRFIGGDLPTLLYTVQLGAIAVNAWHSRVGSIDSPDYAVLDLDPGADVPFDRVTDVARFVEAELEALGLRAAVKTSGSRGIHILVPLPRRSTYDTSATLAEEIAVRVARRHADVATVERSVGARPPGTVYVDHMQNARGKTLAAVLCVRGRRGAPVSTPVEWARVTRALDAGALTIATVPRRLARVRRTWESAIQAGNAPAAVRAAARRSSRSG